MNRILATLLSAALCLMAGVAVQAALPTGSMAPDFKARASLAGKEFDFSLSEALKKGPVVLYFYPAAFTPGCTAEAHEFAEAIDDFTAAGATVIGVSADDIEKLNRFSVSECRGKFAVAADADKSIMKAYDAVLKLKPEWSDRISYVIAPDGKIVYVYSALKYNEHVANTLKAVREWKQTSGAKK
jgi:peroxiredoxin